MSTLRDTKWIYNMTRATSDLSVTKPSVARGFSTELLGVDGTTQGGLRPHNGFRLAHELDFYNYNVGTSDRYVLYDQAESLNSSHKVIDFFPIAFKKGFKTAYGFVYRVQKVVDAGTPANNRSHVFIEYYDPDDNKWYTPSTPNYVESGSNTVANATGNLIMYNLAGDLATAEMDVEVFGRLVYVFVKGRSPALFYIDLGSPEGLPGGNSTEGDTVKVVGVTGSNTGNGNTGTTGPGERPELFNFSEGQPLGELDGPTSISRAGRGQVWLTEETPALSNLYATDNATFGSTNNSYFTSPTGTSAGDANVTGDADSGGSPQTTAPTTTLLHRKSITQAITHVPLYNEVTGNDRLLVLVNLDAGGDTSTYANTVTSLKFDNGNNVDFEQIDTASSASTYQRVYAFETRNATQANQVSGAAFNTHTAASDIGRSNCVVLKMDKAPLAGEILVYKVQNVPTGDFSIVASGSTAVGTASSGTWGDNDFENPSHRTLLLSYCTAGLAASVTFDTDGTTGFDLLTSTANQAPKDSGGTAISGETLAVAFDSNTVNVSGVSYVRFKSATIGDYPGTAVDTGTLTLTDGSTPTIFDYGFATTTSSDSETGGTVTVGLNGLTTIQSIAQKFARAMNAQNQSIMALDPLLDPTSTTHYLVPIIPRAALGTSTGTGTNLNLNVTSISTAQVEVIDGAGGATGADSNNTIAFSGSGQRFGMVTKSSNTNYDGFRYDLRLTSNRAGSDGTNWTSNYLPQQITLALRPDASRLPSSFYNSYTSGDPKTFVDNYNIDVLSPAPNAEGETTGSAQFETTWRLSSSSSSNPIPLNEVVYDVYLRTPNQSNLIMIAEGQPHVGSLSRIQKYSIRRGASPFVEVFSKGRLDYGQEYRIAVVARLNTSAFNAPGDLGTKSPGIKGPTVVFKTGVGDKTAKQIKAGDYAFAYVLYDSRTGRKTSLSDIANIDEEDFPLETRTFDQDTGDVVDDPTKCCADDQDPTDSPSVCEFECETRDVGADRFAVMEIIYDSSKFDKAYIYRSVRTEDAGGTFTAGYLQLDKIITLGDYQTTAQPSAPSSDFKRALYWYTKEDKALVWQPSYLGDSVLDDEMPFGGTAVMYDNTMMVTNLDNQKVSSGDESRVFDEIRGIGEIRYSSLAEYSPELFPPLNRYAPSSPNNEVIRLHKVGPYVIGLARDRAYHFRREGGFIAIRELHEGLIGTVNHKASDVAGSSIYTISSKGIKIIDANGQFKSMAVIDRQIKEEFKDDYDRLQVAFDPFLSCLFFYNPPQYSANKKSSTGKCSIAWFETSMVTQLEDLPFDDVKQGAWPRDENIGNIHEGDSGASRVQKRVTDYDGDVVTRALWLQNAPDVSSSSASNSTVHNGSDVADNWRPRIWVANNKRDRNRLEATSENTEKVHTLLDTKFDHQFAISSATSSTIVLDTSANKVGANCEGAKVYVTKAAAAAQVGTSYTVTKVVASGSSTTLTLAETVDNSNLASGDRISMSPVHFRAVGHNVGVSATRDDTPVMDVSNFHRVKQVGDLMASFIDVSGDANAVTANDAFYRGVLFVGSEDSPTHISQPLDSNGLSFKSINSSLESVYPAVFSSSDTNFVGSHGVLGISLSPGVECFCSDLDYRLLSFRCDGKIQPSETTELSDIDS